jgi:predicted DNA binding CopG/RHH family protein
MKKQKLDNRLELRVSGRMLDFLKRRAKKEGSSISHIVREIIRRVIDGK